MVPRLTLLVAAVAGLLLPSVLSAQTVTTQPLSATSFCVGQTVSVDFTVSGSFVPGNAMILQLSDPNGSFTTGFRNMKSISTTASGTIEVVLPGDLVSGTKYRFRVIASNPKVNGPDNGSDVTIYTAPQIAVDLGSNVRKISGKYYAVEGRPIQTRNSTKGASSYWWNFGVGMGGSPEQTGDAAPVVTYAYPGEKLIRFLAYTPNGCEWFTDMRLTVLPLTPTLPADVLIIQGDTTLGYDHPRFVWICPGGTCRFPSRIENGSTIFIEGGGSVVAKNLFGTILYAKAGASMNSNGEVDAVIIHEAGVSLPADEHNMAMKVEVPTLTFDYTNVPPGGCPSLAPYTVQIKQNASSIHSAQNDNRSNVDYWVQNGGSLVNAGDGNTYCVEAGGHVTVEGSGNKVYLKSGASVDVRSGASNRIFYEMNGTIMNPGSDAVLLPSSGITFVNEVSSVWEESATAGGNLVEISPNPTANEAELRVDPGLGRVQKIELYDGVGKKIEEMTAESGSARLVLRGYAAGRYYVKVTTERGVYSRVVIKE